jgi:hypothetical protein
VACVTAGCSSDGGRPVTVLLAKIEPMFLAVGDAGITWWNRPGSGDGPVERVPKADPTPLRPRSPFSPVVNGACKPISRFLGPFGPCRDAGGKRTGCAHQSGLQSGLFG